MQCLAFSVSAFSEQKYILSLPSMSKNENIMNKVLIIDDEPQIRQLLARILGLEGYEVLQAGDCKAAVKQMEYSPNVILCDVFLPDGNGVDFIKTIKKISPESEIIL